MVAHTNNSSRGQRNVAVVGYYGHGNLGDDLLASYVLNRVSQTVPLEQILVTAPEGSYLEQWFPGIHPASVADVLWPDPGVVRKIIFGGGGLFFTFAQPTRKNLWGARDNLAWTFWRLRSHAWRKRLRFYAFCVGIGPFNGWGGRWITKKFLSSFEHVSVRDNVSAKLLGIKGCRVVADAAIGLAGNLLPRTSQHGKSLGIIIRHWPFQEIRQLTSSLLTAAQKLRYDGWNVQFISFQPASDMDVLQFLENKGEKVRGWDPKKETVVQFCNYLSAFRIIVTMRAHGVFLSAMLGVTPIAIRIEPKLEITAARCGCNKIIEPDATAENIVDAAELSTDEIMPSVGLSEDAHALDIESRILDHWLRS